MIEPQPTVLIDGAIPRSEFERACITFDYLVQISEVGPHSDLDPEHQRIIYPECWTELEDEIIDKINDKLPDNLLCIVGEVNPGDVIIRTREED